MRTILSRWAALLIMVLVAQPSWSSDQESKYFGVEGTYVSPDSSRSVDDGFGARLLVGVPLGKAINLELSAFDYGEKRKSGGNDSALGLGADLMFPLSGGQFRPFLLAGGGYLSEDIKGANDGNVYGNLGLGALIRLADGLFLRADGRYVSVFNDRAVPGKNYLNDVHVNLGLQAALGGRAPLPPPPAPPVSAPADSDGDGVSDALDQCPNTPRGPQVSANGCPLDSDGDGVADYLDKCPNTRAGFAVNKDGCPLDADGDGVPDLLDKCPNTPAGIQVGANGCPRDTDGDGVADALDKCPNTPPGLRVGVDGCVLRQAQTVVLQNVNFESASDRLASGTQTVLDKVAEGLKSQPDLKVEIAGHTDATGADAFNLKLSQRRADAVRSYLISRGVAPGQLQAKGYGESAPVASNKTPAGRAQNRRVEFRVLGK